MSPNSSLYLNLLFINMLHRIILFVSIHYRLLLLVYLRHLVSFLLAFLFISLHYFLFFNSQFCFYLNMSFLPFSSSVSSICLFAYMCINKIGHWFVFGLHFILICCTSSCFFLACNIIFWGCIHVAVSRFSLFLSYFYTVFYLRYPQFYLSFSLD